MWRCKCARIGWDRHGRLTERACPLAATLEEDGLEGLRGKEMERAKLGAIAATLVCSLL
jgi:hypothetical protein